VALDLLHQRPIGILAVLMVQCFIEDPPYIKNQKPGRIDYTAFGLMALGLARSRSFLTRGRNPIGSHHPS
jgi:DHA2 family multidrug resistance protein